jgi:Homing endonuclease associated repeat
MNGKSRAQWTPERITAALQEAAEWKGHPPRKLDWHGELEDGEPARPSATTVLKRFGTWNQALDAAGLRPSQRPGWTRPRVIVEIREWAKRNGRPPRPVDWHRPPGAHERERPTDGPVSAIFGNWAKAVEAAGFEPPQDSWSETEIVAAIRRFAHREGRPPTNREFVQLVRSEPSHPTLGAVLGQFGSWNAALRAAGFAPHRRDWSKVEIIAALRDFGEHNGRAPTYTEWLAAPAPAEPAHPTASTVVTHFGEWRAALKAAGLEAPSISKLTRRSWSEENIIEAIRACASREGRTPSARDWRNAGSNPPHPNSATVAKRFGSWGKGVEAAGLKPRQRHWTHAAIIAALQASAQQEGKVPRSHRWRERSRKANPPQPSCSVIIDRFGSWRSALRAAGFLDDA